MPVVVGEIVLGVLVGETGTGWGERSAARTVVPGAAGFALVMLEAGSHVPLGDSALRVALRRGALLAGCVGLLSVPAGFGIAALAGTGHGLLSGRFGAHQSRSARKAFRETGRFRETLTGVDRRVV